MRVHSASPVRLLLVLGLISCGEPEVTDPAASPSALVLPAALSTEFSVAVTAARELAFDVATDGTNYLVPYVLGPSGAMRAQIVHPDHSLLPSPIVIGRAGAPPNVAWDGTNYLMVWVDLATASSNIFGQFISPAGALVGAPLKITTAGNIDGLHGIAYGSGTYLVAYSSAGRLRARFVGPDRALGATVVVSAGPPDVFVVNQVASNGTDFVAAWTHADTGTAALARLIRANGTLGPIRILDLNATGIESPLRVAFAGEKYFVAWTRRVDGTGTRHSLYGRMMTPAGAMSGLKIQIRPVSFQQHVTSVVPSGSNFFVMWVDSLGVPGAGRMKGRFHGPLGGAISSVTLLFKTAVSGKQPLAVAAANGSTFYFSIIRGLPPATGATDLEFFTGWDVKGSFRTLAP